MQYNLVIKPNDFKCNIQCEYCFIEGFDSKETSGTFANDLLHNFKSGDHLEIVFQGGEPLLTDITWYYNFIAQMETRGLTHKLHFQTNGTKINDEWIKLFKKTNALIGYSLDGFSYESNKYRFKTEKIYQNVINNLKQLVENECDVNILMTLHKYNYQNIGNEIAPFVKMNVNHFQLINLIDTPLSLANDEYLVCMQGAFDYYFDNLMQGQYISIKYFDNVLNTLKYNNNNMCNLLAVCDAQLVILGNGDIFPCDFATYDIWKLGNIKDDKIIKVLNENPIKHFIKEVNQENKKCNGCKIRNICNNSCFSERVDNHYIYCQATKDFFKTNNNKISLLLNLM